MPRDLTHASFFSGVGGLDLGLERAGWRTVSFSEIDPYASAVLAERWPGVPNLGDIVALAGERHSGESGTPRLQQSEGGRLGHAASATLWSGGFPCQDLSVAGKRAGFAGERSSLAFAFLDLVEQHRPPAILLENVPGLLSSHGGRDFGTLLGRLAELGYWWAYRILDAQYFGVPQRRRRVFICALHAGAGVGADSAAEVLSVGSRCGGHSQAGDQAGAGVAGEPGSGPAFTLRRDPGGTTWNGWNTNYRVGPSPDPGGVREADGLAGRLDDRDLAPTLRVGPARPQDGGPGDTVPVIVHAGENSGRLARALSSVGGGNDYGANKGNLAVQRGGRGVMDDPMLPLGLDSHRYRCCGNGVVSNVSEWIGVRLARTFA